MEEIESPELWNEVRNRPKQPIDVAAVVRGLDAHTRASTPSTSWIKRLAYGAGLAAALLIVLKGAGHILPNSSIRAPEREYVTRRGERLDVTLPDGSRVILAPDSRLRFVVARDGGRLLDLSGQAYFSVGHSNTLPFSVKAGGVMTQVLGTSFNVRSYPDEPNTQVAVSDGKVAVDKTVLSAGDIGIADLSESRTTVKRNADIAGLISWTRGELLFTDAPFAGVARELERVYDINIRIIGEGLAERPVTTKLVGNSVADMLAVLAIGIDAKVEQNGQNVVFSLKE